MTEIIDPEGEVNATLTRKDARRQLLHAIRSDWRDLTSAGLALLVAMACLAAAGYRMAQDDKIGTAVLAILAGGVALFGLLLAARKLRDYLT